MPTAQLPGIKFQVQEQIYDSKSMLDETNFYAQRQGAPSELTKTLTYILGSYNKKYPISTMTLGGVGFGINNSAVELDDVQFTYPVMGSTTKASVVYSTEYVGGDKPGAGNGFFYITFPDNWIKRYYVIQSEGGIQAYVHENGEPVASGGYRYKCQLHAAAPADYCPLNQLDPGVKWVDLFTQVAESESRSTESKMVMPGLFKNQMGFMRAGMSWAGNAANKVMKIKIKTDKGETEAWMDYFMWQFEERWAEECEHYYWYSRYNRAADGSIALKDMLTGKVIPSGSGILEQIINKSTYTELTYKSLANKIGDALFGQNDTGNMVIDCFGGTGARREMHRAILAEGGQFLGNYANVADKFVTGSDDNLMLGGFFSGFYHIDGYTIRFKHNPIYDTGRIAKASPLHPKSGLPLESYRMTFIDNAPVEGGPNIRHVAQKGRAYMDGVVKGLTPMPKSLQILAGNGGLAQSKELATVQDKSEYTRFKSGGVQLMRGNRCVDLQCIAGQ
jgi:hypothetical protein